MDTGQAIVAQRYALALYALADEKKALDAVANDLREAKVMAEESVDLRRLLDSRDLSRDMQAKAIAALADKAQFDGLTKNFLGIVAQNRRLGALPAMADAYLAELARRRGEVVAHVTAANELSDAQRGKLEEALNKAMSGKVQLDVTVDPSLLGGLVVKIGSRMIDSSLKSKLQRLQFAMKGVA